MTSIQTAINNSSSFEDLRSILTNTVADISFFGVRYIKNVEFEDTYSLDALARRVRSSMLKSGILNKDDADRALAIGNRITQFYNDTNSCKNKNFITRIFFKIYEFWVENFDNFRGKEKGIRFYWCDENISFSQRYTKQLNNLA